MPLVTIARPAPPAPAPPGRAPGVAVLRFLFWTATLKPLVQGVTLTGMTLYWLGNQTARGRYRYHLRPVYFAATACYVSWWTPWVWLALGFAFDLWREPKRWISALEQTRLRRACAAAAAWQVWLDATPDIDWRVQAALWVAVTVGALWPFWKGRAWMLRDDRPEPIQAHPLVEQWEWEVAQHPKAGPLALTELRHDPATDRFHLRAPIDGDDGVEGASERACRLLCRPRGTVSISPDPEGDANDFLVAVTDRHDASVVRYWSDGNVSERGAFESADSADGRAALAALRGPSGAAHAVILAPSRHGKGIVMRQFGVALARWDQAFLAIADCKGEHEGGAGVPELRAGADVYGWTRDQWRCVVEMSHEVFSARAGRYGRAGRNFYHPDAVVDGYQDPLFATMIDEMRKMNKVWGRAVIGKLEDIASQGASFGCNLILNTQKGDGESLGSTAFRNDLRGNGTVYIGRYADAQAARDATQGFDVDPTRLPAAAGWWFIKSSLHAVPLVPMRARMLPTRDELEFMDFAAPHGTVEDWLAETRVAKLHPDDEAIVARWLPEFMDAEPEAAPAAEPIREVVEVAAGVHVEEPRRLALVPPQSGGRTARELIPDVLRTAGHALTRGEIADRIGQNPTYVSGLLKEMEGKAVKRATTPKGEPGWTVAAA
jgi:hypothetical protein